MNDGIDSYEENPNDLVFKEIPERANTFVEGVPERLDEKL